jgi:hypothetical protein
MLRRSCCYRSRLTVASQQIERLRLGASGLLPRILRKACVRDAHPLSSLRRGRSRDQEKSAKAPAE